MNINVEGIILPIRCLTNFDLNDAVIELNLPNFKGVFCHNELPKVLLEHECGVLNIDDNSGNGTRWVAWFKSNNVKYYFDSFGLQPPLELINYLGSPIFYNSEQVPPNGTVICGHLCLCMLKKLSSGDNFQIILNNLI